MNIILTQKNSTILIILVLMLGTMFGTIASIDNPLFEKEYSFVLGQNMSIVNICNKSSISLAVNCVVGNVKQIYKYNRTPDNVSLTKEQLLTRGGDCRDWSFYYVEIFKQLGFYSNSYPLSSGENSSHRFASVSDDTGWCIIDGIQYKCYIFGGKKNGT